jgi:hypothetical protein
MKLIWQSSHAFTNLQIFQSGGIVEFDGCGLSGRRLQGTNECREAGTAKCACSAARSAQCSMNTSRSGFSQSICTAWEMHPGSPRERWTCARLNRRISSEES